MSSTGGKIWIDYSHTFDSGLHTGIQRVVQNIVQQLPFEGHSRSITATPVILRNGRFHDATNYEKRWGRDSFRSWKRSPNRSKLRYLPAKAYYGTRQLVQRASRNISAVEMHAGDRLLLTDGYWAMDQIWPAVELQASKGINVAIVLYDLLPMTHAQFFPSRNRTAFEKYLSKVASNADTVLCISKSVASEYLKVKSQLATKSSRRQTISTIRLGSDIGMECNLTSADDSIASENCLKKIRKPYVLQIGTLEPRKNHDTCIKALDRLWAAGEDISYVAVGRKGWMFEELIKRFHSHPEWEKRLHYFEDITDRELIQLYQSCHAVICPSYAEGFGLPIVEGLHYGKPVIASDIPIHREVGDGHCEYFAVDDAEALASRIKECGQSRHQPNFDVNQNSWADCAREILKHFS